MAADALREAAQQALVALVHHTDQTRPIQRTADAIAALRSALSVQGEPVAWQWKNIKTDGRGVYFEDPARFFDMAAAGDYEWAPLYAAPAAPAVPQWQPIETAPDDMGAYLFRVNGIAVQGFKDAAGFMCVQNERHKWRKMRGKPTHWMPLPAAPSAPGADTAA